MIFLFHGTDVTKSRDQILFLKKKLNIDVSVDLSYPETSPNQLISAVNTCDLFGGFPFVIFDISACGRSQLKEFAEIGSHIDKKSVLVIYSDSKVSNLNHLHKVALDLGKISFNEKIPGPSVFSLLDAIMEKNRKKTYKCLTELNETEDSFYIFSMLLYLLRNISYIVLDSSLQSSVPRFSVSKYRSYCSNLNKSRLAGLYTFFYDQEKKLKTGGTNADNSVVLSIEQLLNIG